MSQRGWPSHKASVTPLAQQFWQVRDEVYSKHGLVFVGDRVVIPESLRQEIISTLHDTHIGIKKCKTEPELSCIGQGCIGTFKMQLLIAVYVHKFKETTPILPHEVPDRPWAKLGSDIYLLLMEQITYLSLITSLSTLKW